MHCFKQVDSCSDGSLSIKKVLHKEGFSAFHSRLGLIFKYSFVHKAGMCVCMYVWTIDVHAPTSYINYPTQLTTYTPTGMCRHSSRLLIITCNYYIRTYNNIIHHKTKRIIQACIAEWGLSKIKIKTKIKNLQLPSPRQLRGKPGSINH